MKTHKKNKRKRNKAFIIFIIIGICLICHGRNIKIPGGVLTTYKLLDGKLTNNYKFDNQYSSIDEYVGGDAYNYIIGASLVAGKMSGAMVSKAIYIVGGFLCICLGILLEILHKAIQNLPQNNTENTSNTENAQKQNLPTLESVEYYPLSRVDKRPKNDQTNIS